MSHYQNVSVIITFTQKNFLETLLDILQYQHTSSFEVIVVGSDITDPNIKVANDLIKAREIASGELLLFIKDTMFLYDDFIDTLLKKYNSGKQFDPFSTEFQLASRRLDKPESMLNLMKEINVEIKNESESQNSFLPYLTKSNFSKPLHIVIVSNEFTYFTRNGGVGTLYYQLANALLQMGHFVTLIASGESDQTITHARFTFHHVKPKPIFDSALNIPVYCKNMNWSVTAAEKVREIHQTHKIDVIESALWDVEAYALTNLPEKIPVVVRLVTPLKIAQRINRLPMTDLDIALGLNAETQLMTRASALAVISENIGSTIQEEYPIKSDTRWHRQLVGMQYWPEATQKPTHDELMAIDSRLVSIPENAFKVLFVGRLEMRKGIDILLNAAWQCMREDKEIMFIIAGRNSVLWQTYVKEKLGNDFQDRLIFLDEISLEIKDQLYAFSDLFTFPSRFESFGMVGLEATVHGKPIVAARAGGIPEVVVHEENGLLFPIGDVEGLTEALLRIKRDKSLYEKLSKAARDKRKLLSARNMAIESLELYESVQG